MDFSTLKKLVNSPTLKAAVISTGLALSQAALAQGTINASQVSGLCVIPQLLKIVVGIVAVGALLLWTIAHMNSKNELSDLTLKIAIPVVIAGIAGYLVGQFGLQNACNIT